MPFVLPTLSDAFGSRNGVTGINGSLQPSLVDGAVFNIGASIEADPPFGAITTTTSWGFNAGLAPGGTTSLVVTASGMTVERATTGAVGFGAYASASAELSITIEEFAKGGPLSNPLSGLVLVRSVTSAPTPIIHIWSAGLGFQLHDRGPAPVFPVMATPSTPGRFYRCWFNAVQSAMCQGATGPAWATCNFAFGFLSAFFVFS